MDLPPMSIAPLRERGKARRIDEIVAAASDLWRGQGIDSVSLAQIAARAEVAPQTIYNLIGGIDAIGFAVIKVALNEIDSAISKTHAKGIALAIASARFSAELYVADAALYRQVLVRIPRVLFEGTHLGRDAADTVIKAMVQAQVAGEIISTVDPARVGRAIYLAFLGTIYNWASGDFDNKEFIQAAEVAVLCAATACATERARSEFSPRLFSLLAAAGKTITIGETLGV